MELFEAGAEASDKASDNECFRNYNLRENVMELEFITKYDGWIVGHATWKSLYFENYWPKADLNCGALSAAILRRSDHDVEEILQRSPKSIHEHNLWGQSPLHLSCSWPKGIILLLRHGGGKMIDRPDRRGSLPLAYSCASNCLEAVKLMLEADSALYSSYRYKRWPQDLSLFEEDISLFEEALCTSSDEIINHLQTALVDRRSRLYSLATTKLCCEDLERLEINDDRILDEKACDVYKVLENRNIPIPSALRTPSVRQTVFHNKSLSPALGEQLYGHGLIDVDGIDCRGLTPSMYMVHPSSLEIGTPLQRIWWLRSKGANLGRKIDLRESVGWDLSITAAHYICSWVGTAAFLQDDPGLREINHTWPFGFLDKLDDNCQSLLEELFSSELYDNCLCACSSHGCTPMLKGITQYLRLCMAYEGMTRAHHIESRIWVIAWMESRLGHRHEAWRWLSREIIQYETFQRLRLTHTCCAFDYWGELLVSEDNMDREEIRDEERFLIGKLDALVAEFQEKYLELGVSVTDFLKGYWKARMEEVEREEELLDDEDVAKIRDMGVVIHSWLREAYRFIVCMFYIHDIMHLPNHLHHLFVHEPKNNSTGLWSATLEPSWQFAPWFVRYETDCPME